jgi:hypothetical protein
MSYRLISKPPKEGTKRDCLAFVFGGFVEGDEV